MRTGNAATGFSEKSFYLHEFRGRSLALAVSARELSSPALLGAALGELEANRTRVVLLSTEAEALESVLGTAVLSGESRRLTPAIWRALRRDPRVGVALSSDSFAHEACAIAVQLGVPKLVWIDEEGALLRPDGSRLSFVDLEELRGLPRTGLPEGRARLLDEIEAALVGGLPAVNLCTLAGLEDDLFTYAGSGTFFTRERYVVVRPLTIDDFDAADDLMARGVAEGYLAPRTPEQIERVLGNAFGAFVEDKYLSGIGALLHHADAGAGEIASVYTLTRFLGEGIGADLIGFAVERARSLGCSYVFACTTSERVVGFFERNGFRPALHEEIPPVKWKDYDPARRAAVRCLRREVG